MLLTFSLYLLTVIAVLGIPIIIDNDNNDLIPVYHSHRQWVFGKKTKHQSLQLPNKLSSSSLSGKFLHITDLHIDPLYLPNSDVAQVCHHSSPKKMLNTAGHFGTILSGCDTPHSTSNATFDFIREKFHDIDFVIYSGDTLRHDRDLQNPRSKEESLRLHEQSVEYFRTYFDLDRIKFIPTLGNNDVFEHDQLEPGPNDFLQNIFRIWAPLKLNLTKDFLDGGYFRQDISHPDSSDAKITVLSLNSMYFYDKNLKVSDCGESNSAGAKQLEWIENELKSARAEGRKVYFVKHIPPQEPSGEFYPECLKMYAHLLGKYSDTIFGHFSGHTNDDTLTFVLRKKKEEKYFTHTLRGKDQPFRSKIDADDVVLTLNNAPSVIPVHNPAIREFAYSIDPPSFGQLLDYTQYYSNMKRDNLREKIFWQIEYRASDVYGINTTEGLTTKQWKKVLKSFQGLGSVTWSFYFKFSTVSGPC